jgi:hypothetical protein
MWFIDPNQQGHSRFPKMFHITLVSTIIISILNVKVHLINRYVVISQGCLEELEDNLEPVGIAVGVLAIIFAIIEVLLILMALGLCCRVYMAKRQSVV